MSNEQPSSVMMTLLFGKAVTHAIGVAANLELADHLKDGPRSVDVLAAAVGAHAPSLYRLMRALAMVGLFEEHAERSFALTPVGACLRTDVEGSLNGMARIVGEGWHSAAYAELIHSVQTGASAFEKVFGMSGFEWFSSRPKEAAVFDTAMTSFATVAAAAIVEAYDFSACTRIADVGGGRGLLLRAVLRAAPKAHGVLFDLPHVVQGASVEFERSGLANRSEVVAGSFFEKCPPGCDVLMMKNVIHDWQDTECVAILQNCRAALAPGGRVLLIENVMTPPGVPSLSKLLDLEMLTHSGGKERTEAEYSELLAKAGLRLLRMVPAPPTSQSVLEAVALG